MAHHAHQIIAWPVVEAVRTVYCCPQGHSRDAESPPFVLHDPPKMVWCSSCRRPYTHMRWMCICNLPWKDCLKHRPFIVTEQREAPRHKEPKKGVSASSSAARLNVLEPHGASRVIMSAALEKRFPHLVGASMNMSLPPPTESSVRTPVRIHNTTIPDETPPQQLQASDRPDTSTIAQAANSSSSSSSVVVAPARNPEVDQSTNVEKSSTHSWSPKPLETSFIPAGECGKKKSKPFRRVVPKSSLARLPQSESTPGDKG